MEYLKKEEIFFERDTNGELIPVDVILETLPNKPTVSVTPLTKGELSKIVKQSKGTETDTDTDIDVVIAHCKNPVFKEDDRISLKAAGKSLMITAIAIAIFSISVGTSQSELVNEGRKKIVEKELENFRTQ